MTPASETCPMCGAEVVATPGESIVKYPFVTVWACHSWRDHDEFNQSRQCKVGLEAELTALRAAHADQQRTIERLREEVAAWSELYNLEHALRHVERERDACARQNPEYTRWNNVYKGIEERIAEQLAIVMRDEPAALNSQEHDDAK